MFPRHEAREELGKGGCYVGSSKMSPLHPIFFLALLSSAWLTTFAQEYGKQCQEEVSAGEWLNITDCTRWVNVTLY